MGRRVQEGVGTGEVCKKRWGQGRCARRGGDRGSVQEGVGTEGRLHVNNSAIQDCCSELEGIGAGAPHAETKEDKQLQVERDVPRTTFKIGGEVYGCASGDLVKVNIEEKLVSWWQGW